MKNSLIPAGKICFNIDDIAVTDSSARQCWVEYKDIHFRKTWPQWVFENESQISQDLSFHKQIKHLAQFISMYFFLEVFIPIKTKERKKELL